VEQFPHEVKIGDNLYLDERISTKKWIKANICGFKDMNSKFVKPILASWFLIAPASLSDPSTVFILDI
jgi:hypothetical protein